MCARALGVRTIGYLIFYLKLPSPEGVTDISAVDVRGFRYKVSRKPP